MKYSLFLPRHNLKNPLRFYRYQFNKEPLAKKLTLKELLLSDENRFDLEIPKSEPYRQRDLTELLAIFNEDNLPDYAEFDDKPMGRELI